MLLRLPFDASVIHFLRIHLTNLRTNAMYFPKQRELMLVLIVRACVQVAYYFHYISLPFPILVC